MVWDVLKRITRPANSLVAISRRPAIANLSDVFKRSDQQVSCEIDDEVVILNLKREIYFSLDGAGVQIWEALNEPRSVAEICASIIAQFDVSPSECEADVIEILSDLSRAGLVERAS